MSDNEETTLVLKDGAPDNDADEIKHKLQENLHRTIKETTGGITNMSDLEHKVEDNINKKLEKVEEAVNDPEKFVRSLKGSFLDQVNDKAKNVVARAFDYVLSVILILIQALHCNHSTLHHIQTSLDLRQDAAELAAAFGEVEGMLASFSVCARENIGIYRSLQYLSILIMAYGFIAAMFVWVHSTRLNKESESKDKTIKDGIYACTDRVPVFDTLLEIPVALRYGFKSTVVLWALFALNMVGLLFINMEFDEKFAVDATAFLWSSLIVAYNLGRLTGDISQYWILHANAERK